jgi:hypothetical protein
MSRSGIKVYVASASAGRPKGVCISIFRGHTPDIFNCPALQIAAAGRVVLPVRRRGLPGYLVGLVPDGVVRVSDALRSVAVDGNVYVLRRQPWVMPSAVTYRLADGSSRKVLLP